MSPKFSIFSLFDQLYTKNQNNLLRNQYYWKSAKMSHMDMITFTPTPRIGFAKNDINIPPQKCREKWENIIFLNFARFNTLSNYLSSSRRENLHKTSDLDLIRWLDAHPPQGIVVNTLKSFLKSDGPDIKMLKINKYQLFISPLSTTLPSIM